MGWLRDAKVSETTDFGNKFKFIDITERTLKNWNEKIIRMCQNSAKPPIERQEKMLGKKVYFYNTSLNGMLAYTKNFSKRRSIVLFMII